jgi:hypothetical protein
MKWLLYILLTIVSGVLYRLGGWEKGNTKFRDLGCPTIFFILLLTNKHPINILGWLMAVLSFGLMFAALTTYFDWL